MGSKQRVLVFAFVLATIFAIGLALGTLVPRLIALMKKPSPFNPNTLLVQVQTVSELVTVKYVIEKVVIVEDVKWITRLGESRVLLLAHGIVKAGIDLSQLQPGDIEVQGKTISIKLPPARITETYLDERQTRVIERTTGFLRSFDKDLEQNARLEAVEDIRRAARNNNILKEAETRARTQLTFLFKQLGFETVEFGE